MGSTRESNDLLRQDSHFAFGKNWASYANMVTEKQLAEATEGLRRLVNGDLEGRRFLDIGSGSGLHSLAALRLGASEVVCVDIDPDSVATTQRLLERHASGKRWQAIERSVFDLDPAALGRFDVVYSWGVLHHTGDMNRALRQAAALARPGGQFVFALYRRTKSCWFWKLEKRWYAQASASAQARARSIYVAVFKRIFPLMNRGLTFESYVASYVSSRGMDFYHDVHDWMGGWPYESISPKEVDRLMGDIGMTRVRSFVLGKTQSGLFGSGCDEYVYAAG